MRLERSAVGPGEIGPQRAIGEIPPCLARENRARAERIDHHIERPVPASLRIDQPGTGGAFLRGGDVGAIVRAGTVTGGSPQQPVKQGGPVDGDTMALISLTGIAHIEDGAAGRHDPTEQPVDTLALFSDPAIRIEKVEHRKADRLQDQP